MTGDEEIIEGEQDPRERAQLIHEQMEKLRIVGKILVSLGFFAISVANNVEGLQSVGPENSSNPSDWFTQ